MKSIIIFGATGDLATKKLFPSLLHLYQNKELSDTNIIAFTRRDWTDEDFRTFIRAKIGENEIGIHDFLLHILHQKGTFHDLQGFIELKGKIELDHEQVLFLFAIHPEYHQVVVENLHQSGLDVEQSKILIEKPFGSDLKSAMRLDSLLKQYFSEDQIFRIDHYLHKKAIHNLAAIKENYPDMICGLCDNYVEKIELSFLENISIDNRGEFYDATGALRDIGQNHLLELLAMITVPATCADISDGRQKMLENLEIAKQSSIVRGQYIGYRDTEGVKKDSITETFFKIECYINTGIWNNTTITLVSGKNTGRIKKDITLYMKNGDILILELSGENRVLYNGESLDILVDYPYTDAYEKVFVDAINGYQECFVSIGEVLAAWRFVDPIIKSWEEDTNDLIMYPPHTYPQFNSYHS